MCKHRLLTVKTFPRQRLLISADSLKFHSKEFVWGDSKAAMLVRLTQQNSLTAYHYCIHCGMHLRRVLNQVKEVAT